MAKRRKTKKKTDNAILPVMRPNAAGIDIGATEIYVAVPADRDAENVRSFPTFTQDLYRLADWLKRCGIETVAMESTGVYWIPLFQILEERGFEVCLVNARHVKNVPGRRTDVSDCQWLQFLHSVGLLRASYRPEQEVCAVRSLLRRRESLVQMGATHVNHMQKALDQMNLQLHHVISDITGLTGLAILDAILGGKRDHCTLARLRHDRIKASEEVIAKSLVGDYRSEHLFTLRQSLRAYRSYQQLIDECDREIRGALNDFQPPVTPAGPSADVQPPESRKTRTASADAGLRTELKRVFGVDLTKIPGIRTGIARRCCLARSGRTSRNFAARQRSRPGWACVPTTTLVEEKFSGSVLARSSVVRPPRYEWLPNPSITANQVWAISIGACARNSAHQKP
jgi:transposase